MMENQCVKLIDRVKAVFIDSLVIMGCGLLSAHLFQSLENAPESMRLIAFLFVFVLYDPLFTSFAGGTVGHLMIGLRVRIEENETEKICFPQAFIRFLVKVFLGWVSLLTVSGNTKHKAMHDKIAKSVVIEN